MVMQNTDENDNKQEKETNYEDDEQKQRKQNLAARNNENAKNSNNSANNQHYGVPWGGVSDLIFVPGMGLRPCFCKSRHVGEAFFLVFLLVLMFLLCFNGG